MRFPFFLKVEDAVLAKSYLAPQDESVRYRTQAYPSVMAPLLAVETSFMYFAIRPVV